MQNHDDMRTQFLYIFISGVKHSECVLLLAFRNITIQPIREIYDFILLMIMSRVIDHVLD
jgi:hypothetical protein